MNFSYGTRRSVSRGVDHYVYERVRDFLARRHKVPGRGTHRFSCEIVYGKLGLLRLERRAPGFEPGNGGMKIPASRHRREVGPWHGLAKSPISIDRSLCAEINIMVLPTIIAHLPAMTAHHPTGF
jgi:hypothetical protein